MSTYRTPGIILKKIDWGEAGQLFSIYTRDFGKLSLSGRGTKKIKSKLNGQLQYFAVIDLVAAKGKNFDQLTGALILNNFKNIKSDFCKIAMASFGLELFERLTRANQVEHEMFDLLLKYLEVIEKMTRITKKNWLVVRQKFIIKLMTLSGYAPSADDMSTGKKLEIFLKNYLDQPLKTENLLKALSLTN